LIDTLAVQALAHEDPETQRALKAALQPIEAALSRQQEAHGEVSCTAV
jgi:hypothetical protein